MPDLGGKSDQFETGHLEYTQMVRWGNFDKAAGWIAQESAEKFLADAAVAEKLRFTDYNILNKNLNSEDWTATVTVRYEMHLVDELINRTVTEKQNWKFNQTADRWELNTNLFEVIEAARDE